MNTKKLISLILAAVTVLTSLSLVSCADSSPAVMTLGDHKITEAQYSYWAGSYKSIYINNFEDVENTDSYWQSEIMEGITVAEHLDGETLKAVKAILVNSMLFDKYRLSFTEDEEASIDAYISDLILQRADGSKNMMNSILGEYGINTKILKKIYLEEEKRAKVFEYLYGEGGEKALTDEDLEQFYLDNYVRVQMIYIENISTYSTDEEGNRLTDDSGQYIIEELKGEKKEEQDAKVKAVRDGLAAGEDFDSLYEEYSELKDYKNGHYYSSVGSYNDAFYYQLADKVAELEAGETATLESEKGTCIVKKLELDSGAWSDDANVDFFGNFEDIATEMSYMSFIEGYYDEITVDEEITDNYSVATVTPITFF